MLQCMHAPCSVARSTLVRRLPDSAAHGWPQYPDPHFKKRNHKRRIIQPNVVTEVLELLQPGARVLLQSGGLELLAR
jgi:tRNA (guanine-N7-)-methyltransferase